MPYRRSSREPPLAMNASGHSPSGYKNPSARNRDCHGYVAHVDAVAHVNLEGRDHYPWQNNAYATTEAGVDVV